VVSYKTHKNKFVECYRVIQDEQIGYYHIFQGIILKVVQFMLSQSNYLTCKI